jgi:hypothetical protein
MMDRVFAVVNQHSVLVFRAARIILGGAHTLTSSLHRLRYCPDENSVLVAVVGQLGRAIRKSDVIAPQSRITVLRLWEGIPLSRKRATLQAQVDFGMKLPVPKLAAAAKSGYSGYQIWGISRLVLAM